MVWSINKLTKLCYFRPQTKTDGLFKDVVERDMRFGDYRFLPKKRITEPVPTWLSPSLSSIVVFLSSKIS